MRIQMRPMRHLNQNSLVAMNRDRNRKLEEEGVLLLPEILNVEDTCTSLKSLSGVDRVAVQDAISSCRRERDKALNDALCYCNLAERLLVEKREMKVRIWRKGLKLFETSGEIKYKRDRVDQVEL